jgi:hypothetical protein
MRKKRTNTDFSQHVLTIQKNDLVTIHTFKKPGTSCYMVKFINVDDVLLVTGDLGRWSFCRGFIPSKNGQVSDGYWLEKIRISSKQDPYVFDSDVAKEQIANLLKENEFSDEEKEWLKDLSDESDEGEYSYIAKAMDRPGSFEAEMIPRGKVTDFQLQCVFDAFDEICDRMELLKE